MNEQDVKILLGTEDQLKDALSYFEGENIPEERDDSFAKEEEFYDPDPISDIEYEECYATPPAAGEAGEVGTLSRAGGLMAPEAIGRSIDGPEAVEM